MAIAYQNHLGWFKFVMWFLFPQILSVPASTENHCFNEPPYSEADFR